MGADPEQLILSHYPIVIAYFSRAPKGSPSIPSDDVTKWIAKFAFFPHNRDRGKRFQPATLYPSHL